MKFGLEFFPTACNDNLAYEYLKAKYGMMGIGTIHTLMKSLFVVDGYYKVWNDDVALLFSAKNHVEIDTLQDIITFSVEKGIFNKGVFEKYGVLTSADIQEIFFSAVKRRKEVSVYKEILLIEPDEGTKIISFSDGDVNNFAENVDISEQRKRKKRKEKNMKEDGSVSKEQIETDSAHISEPVDSDTTTTQSSERFKEKTEGYGFEQTSVSDFDDFEVGKACQWESLAALEKNVANEAPETRVNSYDYASEVCDEVFDAKAKTAEKMDRSERSAFDARIVRDSFNRVCTKLRPVDKITEKRKKAILKVAPMIEEYGGFDKFFGQVQKSSFLCGGGKSKWRCTFDWLMCPDNAVKVMEGNFSDEPKGQVAPNSNSSFDGDEFLRLALERSYGKDFAAEFNV